MAHIGTRSIRLLGAARSDYGNFTGDFVRGILHVIDFISFVAIPTSRGIRTMLRQRGITTPDRSLRTCFEEGEAWLFTRTWAVRVYVARLLIQFSKLRQRAQKRVRGTGILDIANRRNP